MCIIDNTRHVILKNNQLQLGLIELGKGRIGLVIGRIGLGIGRIELGIGLKELRIGLIELGIGLIEPKTGLMELGIGLRINNSRRTVLARVSDLVTRGSAENAQNLRLQLCPPPSPLI